MGSYNESIKSWKIEPLVIYDFLKLITGDKNSLKQNIQMLASNSINLPNSEQFKFWAYGSILLIIDRPKHNFKHGVYEYKFNEENVIVKYEIHPYGNKKIHASIRSVLEGSNELENINYFKYFGLVLNHLDGMKELMHWV